MKKSIVGILAVAILSVCVVGCDNNEGMETSSQPTEITEPTESTESEQTSLDTSINEDIGAMNNLLDKVMTVYPGSAGTSLRAATVATLCMKFADKTEMTQEEMFETIDSYYENLEENEKETLLESLGSVAGTLEMFMDDWENSKGILEDAGIAKDLKEYVPNKDKILPLYNAFKDFTLEN